MKPVYDGDKFYCIGARTAIDASAPRPADLEGERR